MIQSFDDKTIDELKDDIELLIFHKWTVNQEQSDDNAKINADDAKNPDKTEPVKKTLA